jgi:hypothetical protein
VEHDDSFFGEEAWIKRDNPNEAMDLQKFIHEPAPKYPKVIGHVIDPIGAVVVMDG